ncbi:uncharacterized protein LOC135147255 [Daucus carota subsp. sativus]|uniref:uncharacterized protein LOC135147255 n=1 Tax=Daucus carota subsp. sativus TaxID=79200 RepID=UPI0030838325
MTQLFCRRVPVQKVCPVCGEEEEMIIHALVFCRFATACWHKLHLAVVSFVTDDFKEWFSQMLNRYSKERWCDVAMACWGIWKARNELVWQQKQVQVDNVIKSAFSYFAQWKQTQSFENIALFPNENVGDGVSSWVKPQVNEVKVSVDAAIFPEHNACGLGAIARDSEGMMVYARTCRYWGRVAPEFAETMAVKEALSWSKTAAMKVTIESDCLAVVQVRSKVPMVSSLGLLVEECRQLLGMQNNKELFFIKRSVNMGAHSLARASYSFPDRTFSRSYVPVEVANCIVNDLAS